MMLIRPAERNDLHSLARYVVMAEGGMVEFFTGQNEPAAAAKTLEPFIVSDKPVTRYSFRNALVAVVDSVVAGAIMSFPVDEQRALDRMVLEFVNARGFGLSELCLEGVPGSYYLSTLATEPAFRGKGVGRALIAAAELRGRELGFTRVSLLVEEQKPKVYDLYKKLGYDVLENVHIGPTTYIRMQKTLANQTGMHT